MVGMVRDFAAYSHLTTREKREYDAATDAAFDLRQHLTALNQTRQYLRARAIRRAATGYKPKGTP